MKTICIYHTKCVDGAAAAAVVRHKYPDAELIPTDHGEEPPHDLDGQRVFIVDFSFSAEILKKIQQIAAEFYWFDHHKTAIPIQKEIGAGVLDLNESGATLTWKQLFPDQAVPKILQYVRDKDIWLWELPDSREIAHALRETDGILNPTNPLWERLLCGLPDEEWQKLIEHGRRARRILRDRFKEAVSKGFEIDLDGVKAFAVNWTDEAGEIGEYVYKELQYPVALTFSYNKKEWSFSLRSSSVDVSEIAVRYGGGGHPGAAGFRMPTIEWLFEKRIK